MASCQRNDGRPTSLVSSLVDSAGNGGSDGKLYKDRQAEGILG